MEFSPGRIGALALIVGVIHVYAERQRREARASHDLLMVRSESANEAYRFGVDIGRDGREEKPTRPVVVDMRRRAEDKQLADQSRA